jgi:ribonuclease HII
MSSNKSYYAYIDEVGRGSICGPVLCGVVLMKGNRKLKNKYRDSKIISVRVREKMYKELLNEGIELSFGTASNKEIDKYGLSKALSLASNRAIAKLSLIPDKIYLDGNYDYINITRKDKIEVLCVIKGDLLVNEISAASIFAKVSRDTLMVKLAKKYPNYHWEKNSGYGTKNHFSAIKKYGITAHHRKSFIKKKYF